MSDQTARPEEDLAKTVRDLRQRIELALSVALGTQGITSLGAALRAYDERKPQGLPTSMSDLDYSWPDHYQQLRDNLARLRRVNDEMGPTESS